MMAKQLELRLGMPWNGYDPRSLTRGFALRTLVSEGTGRLIREPICARNVDQIDMFLEGTPHGS